MAKKTPKKATPKSESKARAKTVRGITRSPAPPEGRNRKVKDGQAARVAAGSVAAAEATGRNSKQRPRKPAEVAVPAAPVESVAASHLAPEEVAEFQAMLLEKRAQLLGDVGTLQDEALRGSRREVAGDLSSMPVHMADLGSDNYELEFTLGLIEGERAVVHEIDEALERIRKGTYGICLATGKPIGKARLKAKPWAKYSYEHTLAMEKGRRRGL